MLEPRQGAHMSNKDILTNVPVISTRGVIIFPGQDIMIEVGRPKSMTAIEQSQRLNDGYVWVVSQKDIMVDNPEEQDIYNIGTLSRIKRVRNKDGFMRVTFSGINRAEKSILC